MLQSNEIQVIFRKETLAAGVINAFGAVMTFFYLTVLDPLPTMEHNIQPFNRAAVITFAAILGVTFLIGFHCGNQLKKSFLYWYRRIQSGETPAAEVPVTVRRDVVNYPLYTAGIAALMWLLASTLAGYATFSTRVFFGLFGWGGLVAVIWLYFVNDLLWRPVIAIFFPKGRLSTVHAFRLPILGRLAIVFLFAGILPSVIMVLLSWHREELLLTAPNPEAVLANLHVLQVFLLVANITACIGMAFFITRGFTKPLESLLAAMERLQNGYLDAKVTVTTNDELGYLGERFNQMAGELRQKELLFNANVQLREQLVKIKELENQLREQAIRDPLTGLYNRRYMEEVLHQEIAKAARRKEPLSIVLLDVDVLKGINDTYGHFTGGDQALLLLAQKINALCRAEDTFCRYAGDEFVVLLYGTSPEVAYERALQWKEAISSVKMNAGDLEFGVSFSAGIASYPVHGSEGEELIHRADIALYQAKASGRNTAVVYTPEQTS